MADAVDPFREECIASIVAASAECMAMIDGLFETANAADEHVRKTHEVYEAAIAATREDTSVAAWEAAHIARWAHIDAREAAQKASEACQASSLIPDLSAILGREDTDPK